MVNINELKELIANELSALEKADSYKLCWARYGRVTAFIDMLGVNVTQKEYAGTQLNRAIDTLQRKLKGFRGGN